jgi:hypothetical protein
MLQIKADLDPLFTKTSGMGAVLIRDPVPFWPRDPDPGLVKSQDPDPRWTTRIIFRRASKPFFWVKNLNSLMRIRDGKNSDPGWKKFGSGINIPDSQHCMEGRWWWRRGGGGVGISKNPFMCIGDSLFSNGAASSLRTLWIGSSSRSEAWPEDSPSCKKIKGQVKKKEGGGSAVKGTLQRARRRNV